MPTFSFQTKGKGLVAYLERVQEFKGAIKKGQQPVVKAGVLASRASRQGVARAASAGAAPRAGGATAAASFAAAGGTGGITNVQLAVLHEFGAPKAGIPERSFIRAPFAAHRREYMAMLSAGLKKVFAGKQSMDVMYGRIGAKMAGDMQRAISAGISPENSAATIKRKGSSKPLIDSGQLRQSISWAVE